VPPAEALRPANSLPPCVREAQNHSTTVE
jgi:hypothetical protein